MNTTLPSFFFNGTYNWDERYFVNLGYRRDGTSAFSKDNRWGNFFSLGLGWNMKKESWLRCRLDRPAEDSWVVRTDG